MGWSLRLEHVWDAKRRNLMCSLLESHTAGPPAEYQFPYPPPTLCKENVILS
ncbi:hypothetical protein RLOC_00002694 [Lonchura striata]|uniref:Uncharacterized protein n=1 Tax=Lonchura striata TaxID=40157 RepID=A0A218UNS1_9PASE|nr:hypothetical protein RLOC_00002694 [Lonchura striata domestica]